MENMFEITTYTSGIHSTSDRARLNQSFPMGGEPSVNLQRPPSEMRDQIQTYWKENLQEGEFPEASDFYQTPIVPDNGPRRAYGSYEYEGQVDPPYVNGTEGSMNYTAREGHTMARNGLGPNVLPIDNFYGQVPDDHPVVWNSRDSQTPFVSLEMNRIETTARNVSVKVGDQHRMGSAGATGQ